MPIVRRERIAMRIVRVAVVLLLGVLLVTAFACAGGSGQGSAPAGWSTYSNSSLGFSIQYPQDWTKWEGRMGAVMFVTPKGSIASAIVMIGCYDAETATLTDDYVNECILALKSTFPDANVSESSAITVDGMPAHKFVYTTNTNNSLMKAMDIHSIKDSKDYTVYYLAASANYTVNLETVQQMIASFKFY